MLSFNTSPWQAFVLATAQQRGGGGPSYLRRVASEVLPRLYLTDFHTACNEENLTSLGITHVVSVIESAPIFLQTLPLRTLHIPLSDQPNQDILTHLPVTTSFIRDALAESPDSRVLVHCLVGISRSATVVCAYLIATMGMTPDEALAAVRSKRGMVCPNMGFFLQLKKYAAQVLREKGKDGAPRAKISEGVAEAIRKLKQKEQEPNSSTASEAGISPSSAFPTDARPERVT